MPGGCVIHQRIGVIENEQKKRSNGQTDYPAAHRDRRDHRQRPKDQSWELIFFAIKPTNLSVQPPEAVSNRIYALMTVLKGQAEIEMLALNSKESFEDNKRHYRQRAAEEDLPVISRLLEADAKSLDRLQIQIATAREFFVLVRLREETGMELHTHLSRIQKSLEDQGFKASLASGEDLKRMLGVYFEQNATTEKYEDYDGERWIILND